MCLAAGGRARLDHGVFGASVRPPGTDAPALAIRLPPNPRGNAPSAANSHHQQASRAGRICTSPVRPPIPPPGCAYPCPRRRRDHSCHVGTQPDRRPRAVWRHGNFETPTFRPRPSSAAVKTPAGKPASVRLYYYDTKTIVVSALPADLPIASRPFRTSNLPSG